MPSYKRSTRLVMGEEPDAVDPYGTAHCSIFTFARLQFIQEDFEDPAGGT